jgi:hypothetical protein
VLPTPARKVRATEPTRERRELPVLRALVEYFDDVDTYRRQPGHIGELSGFSEDKVKRALKALREVDEPRGSLANARAALHESSDKPGRQAGPDTRSPPFFSTNSRRTGTGT